MSDDKLLKKCVHLQIQMHRDGNKKNWLGKVYSVLDSCAIDYEMYNVEALNLDDISTKVKLKLYELEQDKLIDSINNSNQQPKLRTYKLFKTDCRLEPYLLLKQNRKIMTKISRFRTSSHSLRIETGRHQKPIIPAPDRICEKCSLNIVEDEIHCLVVCPSNKIYRDKLFICASKLIDNFQSLDDIGKFVAIMNCKEPELLLSLGKFLQLADV